MFISPSVPKCGEMMLCSVNGCEVQARYTGMCSAHYSRKYNGKPIDAPVKRRRVPCEDHGTVSCYECRKAKERQRYRDNREAKLAYQRAYYPGHREEYIAQASARRRGTRVGMDEIDVAMSLDWQRAIRSGPCAECGSVENIEIDHIRAAANGGTDLWYNLQPLCRPCNRKKWKH